MNNMINQIPTSLQSLEQVAMMLACKLKYLQEKLARYSQCLTFLIRCRNHNLVPKGLQIKLPVKSEKAFCIAWRTSLALVRERIEGARRTKTMLTKDISEISAKLSNTTQPEDFSNILHWVNCHKNKVNKKSKKHLIKKYEYLLNQDTSKTKHFQLNEKKLVVNLSNHNLTEPQNNVLALGLNFATNPKGSHTLILLQPPSK